MRAKYSLITFLLFFILLFAAIAPLADAVEKGRGISEARGEKIQKEDYDIQIRRPLISVPEIKERGDPIKIWVRNPRATLNTTWEVSLWKKYSENYTERFGMRIIDVRKAYDKGDHDWYIEVIVPEEVRNELYNLNVSDGEESDDSLQSVDVVEEIDDKFTFVQATDTHLGYVEDNEPAALNRIRQFIEEMNLIQPDFIVHTGDASDKEPDLYADQDPDQADQDEKFYELLQELEVPIYIVPGNHDYSYTSLTGNPGSETSIKSYQRWINPHLNYTFTYGKDYNFVMQNSGRPAFPFEVWWDPTNHDGLMSMENVTWMEEKLKESRNKTMQIVAIHAPAYPDTIYHDDVRDAFRENVSKYDVDLVLAGHTHSPSIYNGSGGGVPDDPTEGDRPLHVTTADVSKSRKTYRVIEINGSEIEEMTYEGNGHTQPLGRLNLDYRPKNNGNNSKVTATLQNNLTEGFNDVFLDFNVPPPFEGYGYTVKNATVIDTIDCGTEQIYRVKTSISNETTKNITMELNPTLELEPGWQLISIPLKPEVSSVDSVLNHPTYGIKDNYDKVMYLDSSESGWKTYVPGRVDRYNSFEHLDHKKGFWIHITRSCELTLKGTIPSRTNITLDSGWNMVGYPSEEKRIANDTLPSEVSKLGIFNDSEEYDIRYIYDLSNLTMKPREGYMIYNSANSSVRWRIEY
ncbi:MAG: metallophosphoesterase [Candidatus Thermoplasmatota archaeon]|nr:metallophosphoesterase [Candidatus Thermoplasmatota archaeon]